MKKKLRLNKQTVRKLITELATAKGGFQETEPYSFCSLCEPYTVVTCHC